MNEPAFVFNYENVTTLMARIFASLADIFLVELKN